MKTKTIILSILLAMPMWVLADTTIWSDAGKALSYDKDNTPFIGKAQFASAQEGSKLILRGSVTGEGDHRFYFGDYDKTIHIKGGIDNYIGDLPVEVFLTEDMITDIKSKDLRIYGEGITLTSVDLSTGKAGSMHFGTTIWTGYFWIPSGKDGNAMKLFKEAIPADLSGYKALRIFHEANSTGAAFNFIKDAFADEDANTFATQDNMAPKTTTYYDLPLTSTIKTALGGLTTQLIIQGFSDGDGFNMTDVILIPNDPCDNCFYYQY